MTLRARLTAGLFILALLTLILGSLSLAKQTPRHRQRLPDGTVLELVSVSYGTNHSYRSPSLKPWQNLIRSAMPLWLSTRLGVFHPQGSMALGSRSSMPSLTIFTGCQEAKPSSFSGARLEISDDHGNTFAEVDSSGTLSASAPGGAASRIDGWVVAAFPRRGKMISVRFLVPSLITNRPDFVAQFIVPNPCPPPYPTWAPEPIPATKSAGDLRVTLNRFITQAVRLTGDEQGPKRSLSTALGLRAEQDGVTNNSWYPKELEFTDATGNRWVPYPDTVKTFKVPLEAPSASPGYEVRINRGLWPGERAWKLAIEFSKLTDFEPDETWSVRRIPVPSESEVLTLGAATNIAGSRIQWLAISGSEAQQPGNLRWAAVKSSANISVRIMPMPADRRFSIVKAIDDQNRTVTAKPAYEGRSTEMVYGLDIPRGAKELEITVALHKSRFAEFLVGPRD